MSAFGDLGWVKAEGRSKEKSKASFDIIQVLQNFDIKLMTSLANFGYEVLHHLLPDKAIFQLESWQFDEGTSQIGLIVPGSSGCMWFTCFPGLKPFMEEAISKLSNQLS